MNTTLSVFVCADGELRVELPENYTPWTGQWRDWKEQRNRPMPSSNDRSYSMSSMKARLQSIYPWLKFPKKLEEANAGYDVMPRLNGCGTFFCGIPPLGDRSWDVISTHNEFMRNRKVWSHRKEERIDLVLKMNGWKRI